jgi:hypothetical protein
MAAVAGFVLLALATGCGSRLNHTNVRTFRLGQTTEGDLRAKFGKPDLTEDRSEGSGTRRVMRWTGDPGTPTMGSLRDVRFLVAETRNGRMSGWIFASTAPGAGRTKFNEANVPKIVKGQTTRDDALRLLGEPAGRALRGTLIPDYKDEFAPGVEEVWAWLGAKGNFFKNEIAVRELLVKFDGSGRVVDFVNRTLRG